MTEKEKAKAYDKAIEIAKKWYNSPNIDKMSTCRNRIIEEIFPEFKESGDEKIRTAILNHLKKMWGNCQDDVCGVHVEDAIDWLEKQDKKSSWKPSKEEMDVLYSLSYITNEYDEYKEYVITHLYQDLKREFFNDSSYENMFSLDNKEDDVRRRSTIQVLEYARSLDAYNQYGKADIDKNIAWLEKQGEQTLSQINERAWLYLVSDVLTWKDGIGQYLDDQRVQELSKRLCSEYARKLYNPSVLSNSSDTGKNEQNSTDKIEPIFKVGDWVVNKFGDSWYIESLDKKNYQVYDGKGNYNYFPISKQEEMNIWTIQYAKDGDILACKEEILLFKSYSVQERISLYCWYNGQTNNFHSKEVIDTLLTKRNKICPATKEQRDLLFQKIKEAGYKWNVKTKTLDKLVKPKFDPKTLNLFDRILVRNHNDETWSCKVFSNIIEGRVYKFATITGSYKQCIPYNDGTKHLIGTTEEAPEYYKCWKE